MSSFISCRYVCGSTLTLLHCLECQDGQCGYKNDRIMIPMMGLYHCRLLPIFHFTLVESTFICICCGYACGCTLNLLLCWQGRPQFCILDAKNGTIVVKDKMIQAQFNSCIESRERLEMKISASKTTVTVMDMGGMQEEGCVGVGSLQQ